jgi:hypothetical protein
VDHHHFTVDDRLTGDIEGPGNQGGAFRPLQTIAGIDLLLSSVQMDLDAVAVVFDFMQPLSAHGRFGL